MIVRQKRKSVDKTSSKKLTAAIVKSPEIANKIQPQNALIGIPRQAKSIVDEAYDLCFHQLELKAADLVKDLAFDSEARQVHDLLARFFANREEIASRTDIKDPHGARWAEFYRDHPKFLAGISLSAVLIVKDEEAHIERCLKSISAAVDEIVITDTGSTDRTLEIIASLKLPNLKLGKFKWSDDFSAARNAALELATGDWCLWIDADEELTKESIPMLREGLMRRHFGGYLILIKNFTESEGDESLFLHQHVRLFQRLPEATFKNRIHEQVWSSLKKLDYQKATLDKVVLLHHGYRPSEITKKNKYAKYCEMLEKEVREHPEDGFQWFNLANIYSTDGQYTKQEFAGKNALRLLPKDLDVLGMAYQLVASAQTSLNRPSDAIKTLESAVKNGISNILTQFELTAAHVRAGDYDRALESSNRCLELTWVPGLIGDYSVASYKRFTQRAQVLNCLNRFGDAESAARDALKGNSHYVFSHFQLAIALEMQHKYVAALQSYEIALHEPSLEQLGLTGAGRCLVALDQHSDGARKFEEAWKLAPENYNAWNAWVDACEKSGDLEVVVGAYEAFSKKVNPTSEMLVNWGRALDRAGKPQRALECFVGALKSAPEDSNAYFNCGDLLYRLDQFQDAAHIYHLGLRLDKDSVEGWFVLGNSLAMLGMVDGARSAYSQVLIRNTNHEGARHNLGVLSNSSAA